MKERALDDAKWYMTYTDKGDEGNRPFRLEDILIISRRKVTVVAPAWRIVFAFRVPTACIQVVGSRPPVLGL